VINFRFHLVSLVAVFLALALGIVMGYGVLGQPTVSGLQDRVDRVQGQINSVRRDNDRLQSEVDRLNAYSDLVAPFAVTDRLLDTPVVVVAVRGVDADRARDTVSLARRAGATVDGILWLEEKWALANAGDTKALATALNVAPGTKTAVRDAGWAALAHRLTTPPGPGDVLPPLQQAGFVASETVGGGVGFDLSKLDATGARVVVVDGTAAKVPENVLVGPLARAMYTAETPLVFGEVYVTADNTPVRGQRLAPIRTDETLTKKVSTVDDLELSEGRVAGVLALADLGRGVSGDYGYGEGADRPIPEYWSPLP
jgi:copper transport outer membrane protein MctB